MNFKSTAVALALVAGAGWASAQVDPAPITVVLTPNIQGMFGGSFTQSVSGLFVDTFTLLPGPFSGTVSVFLDGTDSVNFTGAILGNQGFPFLPEIEATNDFRFTAMVNSVSPLTLTVLGFSGLTGFDGNGVETGQALTAQAGSYTLSITATPVAAIPEPETYALMLAGLAFVGAVARRRRAT